MPISETPESKSSDRAKRSVPRTAPGVRSVPFTGFDLGTVFTVICRADRPIWPKSQDRDTEINWYPFWGRVHFRDQPLLQLPGIYECRPLQFPTPREMRELRSFVASVGSLGLPPVRVEPVDDDRCVCRLSFMVPVKAVDLTGDVPFIIDQQVLEHFGESDNENATRGILDRLVLRVPAGEPLTPSWSVPGLSFNCFLIREAPLGFLQEDDAKDSCVGLLLRDRDRKSRRFLVCHLEKNPTGNLFLHAISIREEKNRPNGESGLQSVKAVHFIRIPGRLVPIPDSAHAGPNDLGELITQSSALLRAWTQYHRIEGEEATRLFRQRVNHELVFADPVADGRVFRVHLQDVRNREVMAAWCDLADDEIRPKKDYKISAAVAVFSADSASPIGKGHLETISMNGLAVLQMEPGKVPGEHGVLRPLEETDRQNDRRKDARKFLEQGNVAQPGLLELLNDPASASPTKRRSRNKLRGPFNSSQIEAIERATGNTSVMAIQGPPGTGKTRVIVEIIERLFVEAGRTGRESPKILLSSTQNEAVSNALSGLKEKGYFIAVRKSFTAIQKDRERRVDMQDEDEIAGILQNVERRLSEDIALDREIRFLDAVKDSKIMFSHWPSERDSIVQRLVDVSEGRSLDKAVAQALGSIVSDATRYVAEIRRCIQAQEDSVQQCAHDVNTPSSTIEVMLAELSKEPSSGLDCSALRLKFMEWLDSNVHPVLASVFEAGLRVTKEIRRAVRDGDNQHAEETLDAFKRLLAEKLAEQSGEQDHEVDDQVEDVLARVDAWRMRIIGLLQGWEEKHASTRTGVLQEWKRSLEEDPNGWRNAHNRYAQIVGATCQMASPGREWGIEDWFDYVIIDEAARSEVYDLLIPMVQGKRILLVGDQKQLPPMVEHAIMEKLEMEETINPVWLREQSLFGDLHEQLPTVNRIMLDTQYRSHPMIGDALSKAFYEGQILSGPGIIGSSEHARWLSTKQAQWGFFEDHPMVWVDSDAAFTGKATHCCVEESEIVLRLVDDYLSRMTSSYHGVSVGIIGFYARQVDHIESLFTGRPELSQRISVGTVDSFQGKEFPAVILCCSRHDPTDGRVGFLNFPNRVVVALSRAQKQLIVVGSRTTLLHRDRLKGCAPIKRFVDAAGDNMRFADPREIP